MQRENIGPVCAHRFPCISVRFAGQPALKTQFDTNAQHQILVADDRRQVRHLRPGQNRRLGAAVQRVCFRSRRDENDARMVIDGNEILFGGYGCSEFAGE
jgi:hypothetical protein